MIEIARQWFTPSSTPATVDERRALVEQLEALRTEYATTGARLAAAHEEALRRVADHGRALAEAKRQVAAAEREVWAGSTAAAWACSRHACARPPRP